MRAVDRRGTLVALVDRVADGSLERAWVRIPDRSWLGIEPRATRDAPWGWSDPVTWLDADGQRWRLQVTYEIVGIEQLTDAAIPGLANPILLSDILDAAAHVQAAGSLVTVLVN